MRNKKARQIVLDYFGDMWGEKRDLCDCYENPSTHKKVAWEMLKEVAFLDHNARSVQIYGYNTFMFTAVYYGCVDGVQGIVYVTPENKYLIPDSFIQKVLRE